MLGADEVMRESNEAGTCSTPPIPCWPSSKGTHAVEPDHFVEHMVWEVLKAGPKTRAALPRKPCDPARLPYASTPACCADHLARLSSPFRSEHRYAAMRLGDVVVQGIMKPLLLCTFFQYRTAVGGGGEPYLIPYAKAGVERYPV